MNRCTAILGVLALLGVTTAHVGAATFGPGDHWVDTVTEGTFAMDVEAEFTATIPGLGTVTFDLTGPMTVWYGDARDTPDPLDPDHLNYVDTELVSMTLTGTSPGIGSVTLTCGDGVANGLNDGPFYTAGGISETAGDPALADSFFDIFFQADIGGTVVFNKGPLHTVAVIDRIPPLFSTYSFAGGLDVYAVLDPDGPPVAQIPAATLRLVPEPTSLAVVGLGALALFARRRRRARR